MTKTLVDNIELPRFTARSGSMAMRPNESHESVDSSVILTSPLHSQTSKEFKPAEGLHQDEYHINTHTIMPERIGQSDRLSENHHVMRNQHMLMSGPLALCNNPDCTQCPAAYKAENIHQVGSISYDNEFYDMIHKHVDGRARKLVSFMNTYLPIVNPHNKVVQWWNKFFVISCLVAIFVDPLFFFLLTVEKENKCVIFHWPMATSISIARSVTDFFYLLHMFLQFRLTYVAPESTVFGAGDLVSHPKKIALNYLRGYFLFDLFVVLPLPQLRRRDVEQWMRHRRLPEEMMRKIRQAERFNWAATRGVNEEELLANLPEDIQKEIRQHFFESLHLEKYVSLFTLMDKPIMDAIREKLKQKVYIRGSKIFHERGPLEKMVFIVRGEIESKSADGRITRLSEGEVCGEELLTWCLTSADRVAGGNAKITRSGERLFSERTVSCLTNVEAFVLTATDLIEVTTLFSWFFQNPHIQGLARYESSRQRIKAATTIQVAWRTRLKASKHLNVGKGK